MESVILPVGAAWHEISWAIALDVSMTLLVLFLKTFLFAGILIYVSRNEAHRSRKLVLSMVLMVSLISTALISTGSLLSALQALLLTVFIGMLITRKFAWVDLEKAVTTNLMYCTASILISAYVSYGLDAAIYQRATLGRALAMRVDHGLRGRTERQSFPNSPGFVAAVFRSSVMFPAPNSTVGALLAPVRAGYIARQKLAEVDEQARIQASLVNMLSGAGTNVTSRADEMAALQDRLNAEASGRPLPVGSNTALRAGVIPDMPTAAPIAAHEAPATNAVTEMGDVLQAAAESPASEILQGTGPVMFQGRLASPNTALAININAAIQTLISYIQPEKPPSPEEVIGDADTTPAGNTNDVDSAAATNLVTDAESVPTVAIAIPPPPPPPVAVTQDVRSAADEIPEVTNAVPDEPPAPSADLKDLRAWREAMQTIRVSGIFRSGSKACALVNGELLELGSLYRAELRGTNYAFRLRAVTDDDRCLWERVRDEPQAQDPSSTLITF